MKNYCVVSQVFNLESGFAFLAWSPENQCAYMVFSEKVPNTCEKQELGQLLQIERDPQTLDVVNFTKITKTDLPRNIKPYFKDMKL